MQEKMIFDIIKLFDKTSCNIKVDWLACSCQILGVGGGPKSNELDACVCVCVYAHASGKEQNCINIALLNLSRLIKVTFGLDTHKRCSQCWPLASTH